MPDSQKQFQRYWDYGWYVTIDDKYMYGSWSSGNYNSISEYKGDGNKWYSSIQFLNMRDISLVFLKLNTNLCFLLYCLMLSTKLILIKLSYLFVKNNLNKNENQLYLITFIKRDK